MSVTTTKKKSIQQAFNDGDANTIADAARKAKLGTMLRPIKVTFAGLTATASLDITSATARAAATVNDGDIPEGYIASKTHLPPINVVKSLRITASGTAASLGNYIAGDVGSTMIVPPGGAAAAVGIARLSDDGKTITFPNTVTGFVLHYTPRADVELNTDFAPST